ncbi:hypothetical protein M422DRAFT_266530 [Sphaerobolus stellatus SS14]|uniref:Uncharacterized protein n=1 Tax=Sphaerobolus stellatus (strain SS14) TaxID=990650 RepID=A0A0C9V2N6_SPHS4|nr:hypothetical protein M422DRAFT_266530 [Sphaerobolus stellatus SS14]
MDDIPLQIPGPLEGEGDTDHLRNSHEAPESTYVVYHHASFPPTSSAVLPLLNAADRLSDQNITARILPHGSPKHISRWIPGAEDLEPSHNGLLHHRKAAALWTRMPLPNEEGSLRFVVATGRPTGQTRHLQQRKEHNRCEGFSGSAAPDSNIRTHAILCRYISKAEGMSTLGLEGSDLDSTTTRKPAN